MSERDDQIKKLSSIYQGHSADIQLPQDELEVAYGLFKGTFIPEVRDIINIVEAKGSEYPMFRRLSMQLESGLQIRFEKSKVPGRSDRVAIEDGRFTSVLFQINEDLITVEDSNVEKQIVLSGPESLVEPIPSSRNSPAGNALGWIEKITGKLDEIKENFTSV